MDRQERPPLEKIPCQKSNRINGSSIRGPRLIYGKLQVTSRYRSGTLGGLVLGVQKTSWGRNFEFRQLLLECLGIENMATPTASPLSVAFQLWPSLV